MKRGLTLEEAAKYCGVSESTFKKWQADGLVPRPWPGTRRYDRKALNQALDRMSGIKPSSPYENWKAESLNVG